MPECSNDTHTPQSYRLTNTNKETRQDVETRSSKEDMGYLTNLDEADDTELGWKCWEVTRNHTGSRVASCNTGLGRRPMKLKRENGANERL